MTLVVPAESTETVHHETDRVERILVVDDDVRLRTLLQRFLEDKGFVVKTAHDGRSSPSDPPVELTVSTTGPNEEYETALTEHVLMTMR